MLEKFRINYADLVVITDVNKQPKESTRTWFEGVIRHFIRRDELTGSSHLKGFDIFFQTGTSGASYILSF